MTAGAYGLALPGLPSTRWLGESDPGWPNWEFVTAPDLAADAEQHVGIDTALLGLKPHGWAEIDRVAARTTLHLPEPPVAAAWAHPLLGTTALVVAEWSRRIVFHAGVFLDDHGRAWGLLGEREHGKSTALAWLARRGTPILADDLLVTDGVTVLRGPRCVDLRQGAAARFGIGEDIGVIGTRQRWRVTLPDAPTSAPLAGFVQLDWDPETAAAELPVDERSGPLSANRGILVGQQHPLAWLEVLSRPVVRFTRPQRWDRMDDAMAVLLTCLADHGAPT